MVGPQVATKMSNQAHLVCTSIKNIARLIVNRGPLNNIAVWTTKESHFEGRGLKGNSGRSHSHREITFSAGNHREIKMYPAMKTFSIGIIAESITEKVKELYFRCLDPRRSVRIEERVFNFTV
jgi:hypothetical protein